ncbi:putative F-box/LRR-repeat protein At3g59160 [Carex rostrata]
MNNSYKRACMSNDEFDMISSLPDEMLLHILSFLGIRDAVQTSLVSKRWVNLWTSLSHLNFDPYEFVFVDEYRLSTDDRKKALDAKFKEFVEALLSHREASSLDTFLIKILDQDGCSDLVHTCVSYAMKFNPRGFSMETSFLYTDTFACIFSCESIEELCLRSSYNFPKIPEVVNLPRIKRLQLEQIQLDNRCITRLFSGCPVLEDVLLERCYGELSCIFSQKLKYLSLRYCLSFPHSERLVISPSSVESKIGIRRASPFTIDFVWKTLDTTAVGNTFSFIQNLFRCLKLDDYFGGLSDATDLRLHSQDMMVSMLS